MMGSVMRVLRLVVGVRLTLKAGMEMWLMVEVWGGARMLKSLV